MNCQESRLQIVRDNSPGNFFIPQDKNIIYYNAFRKACIDNVFKSFSIKYVLRGTAYYGIDSGLYKIGSDSALVAPAQPGKVFFDEKEEVIVLCVSINELMIGEAFSLLKGIHSFDNLLDNYFAHPEFAGGVYRRNEVPFLTGLRYLSRTIAEGGALPHVSDEWFFELSEKIMSSELGNLRSLSGMSSLKLSTRKELFKRLNMARIYMNEHFLEAPSVNTIAREAALSQFHFFRSFKQAFHITPYQYMQERRLEYAKDLLTIKKQPVSSVTAVCGFRDIAAFSKAFKKKYDVPPSYWSTARYNRRQPTDSSR